MMIAQTVNNTGMEMDKVKCTGNTFSNRHNRSDSLAVYSKGKAIQSTILSCVYNIENVDEIFIAKAPMSIRRNDGRPIVYRMVPGDSLSDMRMRLEDDDEELKIIRSVDPRSLFSNVEVGKEFKISASIGVFRNGKIEQSSHEEDAATKSDKWMNDMLNRVSDTEKALTSSREESVKTEGTNKDSVQIVPIRKQRSEKRYSFINGKVVSLDR